MAEGAETIVTGGGGGCADEATLPRTGAAADDEVDSLEVELCTGPPGLDGVKAKDKSTSPKQRHGSKPG